MTPDFKRGVEAALNVTDEDVADACSAAEDVRVRWAPAAMREALRCFADRVESRLLNAAPTPDPAAVSEVEAIIARLMVCPTAEQVADAVLRVLGEPHGTLDDVIPRAIREAAVRRPAPCRAMPGAHARLAAYIAEHCPTALSSTNTYGDLDNVLDLVAEAMDEWRTDLAAPDDPTLDATDGAHPAWWRGHEHGAEAMRLGLAKRLGADEATPWQRLLEQAAPDLAALRERLLTRDALIAAWRTCTGYEQSEPSDDDLESPRLWMEAALDAALVATPPAATAGEAGRVCPHGLETDPEDCDDCNPCPPPSMACGKCGAAPGQRCPRIKEPQEPAEAERCRVHGALSHSDCRDCWQTHADYIARHRKKTTDEEGGR